MKIQYFGHSCFYIKNKEVNVLMDPFASDLVGFKMPKVEAEIVTVSHQHSDHNQTGAVLGQPMIFDFPGEYEVKGVKIFGYQSFHDENQGKERGENIIFKVVINNVVLTHLGDLGHNLDNNLIEQLEDTDVLLVPVGGFYTIDCLQAKKIMEQIKPSVTIPMHYQTDKHNQQEFSKLSRLSDFLKLTGHETLTPVPKFEIKSEDELPENEIIVLEV